MALVPACLPPAGFVYLWWGSLIKVWNPEGRDDHCSFCTSDLTTWIVQLALYILVTAWCQSKTNHVKKFYFTVVTLVRVVLDPSFDDLATFSHFCNLSFWQLAADRISCFNFHLITFPKIWIIWFYQNSIWLQHKTQNHLYKYTAVKLLESVFKFPISRNLARKPHSHQLPHRQKRKCIFQFSSPWNKFSIFIPVERDVIFSCGVPLCNKASKSGNIFWCNLQPKVLHFIYVFWANEPPGPPAFSLVQTFASQVWSQAGMKIRKGAISWQWRRCSRNEMSKSTKFAALLSRESVETQNIWLQIV